MTRGTVWSITAWNSIKRVALLNLTGIPFNVICTVVEDRVKLMVTPNGMVDLEAALAALFQTLAAMMKGMAVEKISKINKVIVLVTKKSVR
jgi:hypothetical protein